MDERAPGEAVELSGRVLRRNWILPLVGVALAVLGYLGLASGSRNGVIGVPVGLVGASLAIASTLRRSYPLSRPVRVRATSTALEVEGRAPLAVDDVVEAKLVPRRGRHGDAIVTLGLRSGSVLELWLRDADTGPLLGALGLGVGDRRATFRLASRFRTRFLTALGVVAVPWVLHALVTRPMGPKPPGLAELFVGTLLALVAAWIAGLLHGRLTIGADGLTTRWLARDRFVPWADVMHLDSRGSSLETRVVLWSGKTLVLRSPETPDDEAQRDLESRALWVHVDDALRAARARGLGPEAPRAAPARRSRPGCLAARHRRDRPRGRATLPRPLGRSRPARGVGGQPRRRRRRTNRRRCRRRAGGSVPPTANPRRRRGVRELLAARGAPRRRGGGGRRGVRARPRPRRVQDPPRRVADRTSFSSPMCSRT